MSQNHYQVLGVLPSAPAADIKQAYRRLATQLHPDKHGGDHRYAEQFKAVAVAYGVLSDPGRRAQYDFHLQVAARRVADAQRPNAPPRPAPDPAYRGAQGPAAAQPLRTRQPAGSRERHYQPRATRQQVRFNRHDFWLVAGLVALIFLFGISATVVLNRMSVNEHFEQARAALSRQQWPEARQQLDELLARRPDHGEALAMRGQLYQDITHDLLAAQVDYEAALLATDPPLPAGQAARLLLHLAECQAGQQRPAAAEQTYTRALTLDSTLTAAWLARGELRLLELSYPAAALADLRHGHRQLAAARLPVPLATLQAEGAALAHLAHYPEARRVYQQALTRDSANGRTLFLLGRLAQQTGDSAVACGYFRLGAAAGYGYAVQAAAQCR